MRARRRLAAALVPLLLAAAPARAPAGDPAPDPDGTRASDTARRDAIRRGCAYLAAHQNPGGSFGGSKAIVAITALSTLALMADGSSVGRGPYGRAVERGVDYLLKLVEHPSHRIGRYPDGYFYVGDDNTSKMHGQGYAMLAVASALGSASGEGEGSMARRIRNVLHRAVVCAEESQTGTGGWGYEPTGSGEHEGSVTVTIAQGLRAARDVGIVVDAERVKRGLMYLRRSQHLRTPKMKDDDGSFKYSLSTDRSSFALTAAALSSFFLFGEYQDSKDPQERIRRAVAYLRREIEPLLAKPEWFFYGNFYAAWAGWQLDGDEGTGPESFWPLWRSKMLPEVLHQQRGDGSWQDPTDRFALGDVLPTAFAVLTLSIPDEQLPIFQR